MEQSAVKWLINELNDIIGPIEATISGELLLAGAIKRAKQMEKEQQSLNEEKLRKSLSTILLISPVHLKMVSDGRGEFPDSYTLTQKGIDDLVKTIKSK